MKNGSRYPHVVDSSLSLLAKLWANSLNNTAVDDSFWIWEKRKVAWIFKPNFVLIWSVLGIKLSKTWISEIICFNLSTQKRVSQNLSPQQNVPRLIFFLRNRNSQIYLKMSDIGTDMDIASVCQIITISHKKFQLNYISNSTCHLESPAARSWLEHALTAAKKSLSNLPRRLTLQTTAWSWRLCSTHYKFCEVLTQGICISSLGRKAGERDMPAYV